MGRVKRLAVVAAVVVATGAVVAAAAISPGLDAQRSKAEDASVWVLHAGGGGGTNAQYGRINTDVGELDTVERVDTPVGVAQAGGQAYLFAQGGSLIAPIDQSRPVTLDATALADVPKAPPDTKQAFTAGDFVAFLTNAGAVYGGRLSQAGTAVQVDPDRAADPKAAAFKADAIDVDDTGMLTAYSSATASVLRYDLAKARVASRDQVTDGPSGDNLQATSVAGPRTAQ